MNGAVRVALAVTAVGAVASGGPAAPPSAAPVHEIVVLDTTNLWRCFVVRGSELVRKDSGELQPLYELGPAGKVKVEERYVMRLNEVPALSHTLLPPGEWAAPDFDDGAWAVSPGPFYAFTKSGDAYYGGYRPLVLVCLRGRFFVEDPAKVRGLTLSAAFQGGAAVHINGREVARLHLPAGPLGATVPAQDYPREAFVAPDGNVLRHKYDDPKKYPDRYAMRTRRIAGLDIPVSALRKGVNVLAIELHRAPAPEIMFVGHADKVHLQEGCWWPRLALEEVKLAAEPGSAVVPNVARPTGPQVWTSNLLGRTCVADYGDPNEPLRPIRICAVRNGFFSAKVILGSTEPIRGIRAEVSDLKGPGVIPASAVQVRYALPDGCRGSERDVPWFDGLGPSPPDEVALDKGAAAAVQPVWLTLHVPRDAAPGDYEGKATISANGIRAVEVPIRLNVVNWTLADARDFVTHVGLIQSPESLAMKYAVPLWSERHWQLIGKSFELLGQVGTKVVYVTLIRRTHFGNEHGMVRWVRQADGSLKPDVSVAERYLALAVKHLGKIPVVGLYCWEPLHTGHFEQKTFHGDRPLLISVLDPGTGKLEEAKGPDWGTPGCRAFLKEAIEAMRGVLTKHGLDASAMIGLSADYAPSATVVGDLAAAAPGMKWIAMSHVFWEKIQGQPVGYLVVLWGMSGLWDPAYETYGQNRFYGWKDSPFVIARFPRDELRLPFAHPGRYRICPEEWMVARGRWMMLDGKKKWSGTCGFGRVGADFWPVMESAGGELHDITRRYPAESSWGQLTLDYSCPAVLAPGKEGAIATGRLEMLREGLQEAEARVFIEKALLDPAKRARLGDELAARCQAVLDERVRDFLRAVGGRDSHDWLWFVGSGWRERSERLFTLAADVARSLGTE